MSLYRVKTLFASPIHKIKPYQNLQDMPFKVATFLASPSDDDYTWQNTLPCTVPFLVKFIAMPIKYYIDPLVLWKLKVLNFSFIKQKKRRAIYWLL